MQVAIGAGEAVQFAERTSDVWGCDRTHRRRQVHRTRCTCRNECCINRSVHAWGALAQTTMCVHGGDDITAIVVHWVGIVAHEGVDMGGEVDGVDRHIRIGSGETTGIGAGSCETGTGTDTLLQQRIGFRAKNKYVATATYPGTSRSVIRCYSNTSISGPGSYTLLQQRIGFHPIKRYVAVATYLVRSVYVCCYSNASVYGVLVLHRMPCVVCFYVCHVVLTAGLSLDTEARPHTMHPFRTVWITPN